MKKMIAFFSSVVIVIAGFSQDTSRKIALIPEPVSLTQNASTFSLPQSITISAASTSDVAPVITFLKTHLSTPTGLPVNVSNGATAAIKLVLNKSTDATIGNEGYHLSVKPSDVTITANKPAG